MTAHHDAASIGDRAIWLPTGAVAFRRMLVLIAEARHSIRCETYIWRADGVGNRILAALAAAAARGVKVQVLVDGVGSSALPKSYWLPLLSAGGYARVFNPISWRYLALRNHRKLLLVDDAVAVIGGFNIGDEYDGDGVTHGWRDLGLELQGSQALHQLADSFDGLFRDHRPRRGAWRWPQFFAAPGPVLFGGPRLGRNQFRTRLLTALRDAQQVRIVAAYFMPGFRLRRSLSRIARRGGTVELLLAGKTDVPLAQAGARSIYGPLLRAGVRIWEYQPQVLHSKLAIIGRAVYAGTANLDARSLGINYEFMIRLQDRRLADEAGVAFAADLLKSREITLSAWRAGRTWLIRLQWTWARFVLTKFDPWISRRQLRDPA